MKRLFLLCLVISNSLLFIGCAGVQSFPNRVMAGETVSIGMGWQKNFTRENTTVSIFPAADISYDSGNPLHFQAAANDINPDTGNRYTRGIINLYPDPVSWLVVGTETAGGTDERYVNANSYGSLIGTFFTGPDKDWWQTVAFIDTPTGLASGEYTIELSNTNAESKRSNFMIVGSSDSTRDAFQAELAGPLSNPHMEAMERSSHYEVSFTGSMIPHAIQVELTHDAGGSIHVVNTRGDLKNIIWSDNGATLKVILTPVKTTTLAAMNNFKFYIAGEVQNVRNPVVQAFDINGDPVVNIVPQLVTRN